MGNNNSTPGNTSAPTGNNTSAPTGNNGTKAVTNNNVNTPGTGKNTKNSTLTNAAAATPTTPVEEPAPAEEQVGGRRRRRRSHKRRRTHRRHRGGAANLTLRYTPNQTYTPTGPSFSMNNPTFSPSANSSRRSSVVSMSNEQMSAYANMPSESSTNNGTISRASFAPTTVRKNRKSRKNRKNRNRKNRKSRSRRN